MLSKFLIVGVGGSGGKTLRVLRQALLRKLNTVPGWEKPELPDAWQMLWIDSITNQSPGAFPEPILPNEQYLGLVSAMDDWQGITHSLTNGLSASEAKSAYRSWLPKTPEFDPKDGAGQYRAVGRAIALSQLEIIKNRLDLLKAKMDQNRSLDDLKIISEGLGYKVDSNPPQPFALVVSSLAGGTGAGMFADIADVLKTPGLDFDPKKILSILYGPDVFLQSLPQDLRGGVAPNTLSAVHEIIYGSRADGPDAGTRAVYRSNKMSDEKSDRIGSAFTFLMGKTNTESVSFDDQDDVYRAVGQSLTPWVLSEEIQTYFNEFLLAANGYPASGDISIVSDNSGLRDLKEKKHTQSMAGFGFARLGLGIDRFNEYVAEVLAKESIDKLLWPRISRTLDPNINLDELIQETISKSFIAFRAQSGLHEKDPGNDVIDYIFKEDQIRSEASTNYKQKVMGRFRKQIGEGDSPSSAEVVRALDDSANREAKDFKSTVQKVVLENTVLWVDYIQQKFINLVVETAGSVGLEVTSALIKRLAAELQTDAYMQLTSDAGKFSRRTTEQRDEVAGRLGTKTSMDASSRILDPLLGIVIDAQMSGAKGFAYRQAAELVRDIAKNYLLPLAKSLDSLQYALSESANAQRIDGEKNPYLSWPALGSMTPTQLQPGPTELVLIEPDDYPKILENMFKKSMPTKKQGQWSEHLISSVISGIPIDGGSGADVLNQDLIETVKPWSPAGLNNGLEVVATFKFKESVRTYLTRAQRTPSINKAVKPYGTFVTQSLVEYLADDSAEVSDNSASRNAKFGRLFSSAVRTSAPLMDINGTLLNQVHARSQPPLLLFGSPVPKEVEDVVRKELTKSNTWNLDGAGSNVMMQFTTNKADEITLFQMLAKTYHPMVFNTLWQPIEQIWGGLATKPGEREAWWGNDRRARSLSEAIPATKDRIDALITGWFVAGFLKQRQVGKDPDPDRGVKLSILDERGNSLSFPHPLLGLQRNSPTQDQLPAVLMSLGIALMKCNTTSSLDPLKPYWRMMEFGDRVDELLGQWIRIGKISSGVTDHTKEQIEDSPEARRAWLLSRIDKAQKAHEKVFTFVDESESLYNQPQVWEIRDLVLAALDRCEQAANLVVDVLDDDDDSVEVE